MLEPVGPRCHPRLAGGLMKILLAEGDQDLADFIGQVFQREGHTVIRAMDGEAAGLTSKAESPDLILLDMTTSPRISLWALRKLRQTSEAPILILTDLADEESLAQALRWGADDYLNKPFRPRELKARADFLLRRSERPDRTVGKSRASTGD